MRPCLSDTSLVLITLTLFLLLTSCATAPRVEFVPSRTGLSTASIAEPRPQESPSDPAVGSKSGADKADMAAAVQNPIASTVSVPFENNFGFGADGGTQYMLNIQPVIPTKLNDDWNLIHRPILPIVSQTGSVGGVPQPEPGANDESGLGDMLYAAYFSPARPKDWIWGVAPAVLIPTSTDSSLGAGEWGAGVSAVALRIEKPWLYGLLVTQVWSFEGAVNQLVLQPFFNYNLSNGWFIESSPQFSANWNAPGGTQWLVPLGGGVGKVFKIGSQPMAARAQAFYNADAPAGAAEWSIRLTLTFLFPKG